MREAPDPTADAGMPGDPAVMCAAEAAAALQARRISAEELASANLARIARIDPHVKAFSFVDPGMVIRRAREIDKTPRRGSLHGLTVAVKDVIDTYDMPTQQNSPIYIGHQPSKDAAVVACCRALGAVFVGKTDTVEFAAGGRLAATRNPHDLRHTPGGTSSGSAAAVASGMAALALGTQTGGSTLRPASFCGIFGFKPTHGVVSQEGSKLYSTSLDTIGWFGRSVADLSLLAEELRITRQRRSPRSDPRRMRIGLCRTPWFSKAQPEAQRALEDAVTRLARASAEIEELNLPDEFDRMVEVARTIMLGEGRAAFLSEYLVNNRLLHQDFKDRIEKAIEDDSLREAKDFAAAARPSFERAMTGLDCVITIGAVGEAPRSLDTTGDALFQRVWTALHVPCVALPASRGPNQMPVGVQLVAPRYKDADLLDVAAAVAEIIGITKVSPVEPNLVCSR
ncbi:MAG TPA: amidase [Casimicrobiaceae bacterium]|nr:amidase [Casimicrobiaceae bacterium]